MTKYLLLLFYLCMNSAIQTSDDDDSEHDHYYRNRRIFLSLPEPTDSDDVSRDEIYGTRSDRDGRAVFHPFHPETDSDDDMVREEDTIIFIFANSILATATPQERLIMMQQLRQRAVGAPANRIEE
jgi:hypothetical protein